MQRPIIGAYSSNANPAAATLQVEHGKASTDRPIPYEPRIVRANDSSGEYI